MGESVSEGTVLEWLKQVGDTVAVDEGIVEISTDKVDAELPSPVAGTIVEILAEPDETVPAGTVVVRIAVGGEPPAPDAGRCRDAVASAASTPEPRPQRAADRQRRRERHPRRRPHGRRPRARPERSSRAPARAAG